MIDSAQTTYSLYFHVPFCAHRCAYCDFNTYAGQQDSIPAYVNALCGEIAYIGDNAPAGLRAHTIYFGGGTPSLLGPDQFESVLNAARKSFDVNCETETTIEANPGTVSSANLLELRRQGINRISFGVQSANTEELRMLERVHDFLDVIEAVSSARKAGFENLNLDLIYGIPGQTLETWQTSVRRILGLRPEHISAYALTLEHGTPFGRWSARGLMAAPDPDQAAEMYEWGCETLEAAGYLQYEISNWAKPGRECRHNLQYWRGLPYLGMGAGAHGYANGLRYSNVLRIKTYIERVMNSSRPNQDMRFPLTPAAVNQHLQSEGDDMSELMITGLRLTRAGIAETDFRQRFGRGLREVYPNEIDDLVRNGLLEWARISKGDTSRVLRLTPRGRLLGNQVFMQFVT